jgi:hypothetical protein
MKKLLLLFAAHALCDYPLQGDFLARGKNHKALRSVEYQQAVGMPWQQALLAHALIHAGAVLLITESLPCALGELALHAATDYAKCDGRLTFNQDQAIHYGSKVVWAAISEAKAK